VPRRVDAKDHRGPWQISLVGKRVGAKDHRSLAAKLQVSHFHCTHLTILMSLVGKRVVAKDRNVSPRTTDSLYTCRHLLLKSLTRSEAHILSQLLGLAMSASSDDERDKRRKSRSPLRTIATQAVVFCCACGRTCQSASFDSWVKMGPNPKDTEEPASLQRTWSALGTGVFIDWEKGWPGKHGVYLPMCMCCMRVTRSMMSYNSKNVMNSHENRIVYSLMAAQLADKLHALEALSSTARSSTG
jgi:hypothetical protein